MTLYRDELYTRALELTKLFEEENIRLSFDNTSFRDYLLIMQVFKNYEKAGVFSLYYKPTKKSFSFKVSFCEKGMLAVFERVWEKSNSFSIYPKESGIYEVFVDGSYINGVTSYGVAIYLEQDLKAEISGIVRNTKSHQLDGELQAVIEAIKWCENNNVDKVRINYDYIGIEHFAKGDWKPSTQFRQKYAILVSTSKIAIEWRNIDSHTGNIKNNRADQLAKSAAKYRSK
ncbi:MAG: hypothetical protein LBU55_05845 [Elusimicrobiota bacterium]|jgi:ribonuclease HI|nr:hypothetical protein [Elusimicrobiota bacterium]